MDKFVRMDDTDAQKGSGFTPDPPKTKSGGHDRDLGL